MKKQILTALILTSLSASAFALPQNNPQPLLGEMQDSSVKTQLSLGGNLQTEGGADRLQERLRVAADGADRTDLNRVAEGGAERTPGMRVAADGADRAGLNRVAEGGAERTPGMRVAADGTDRTGLNRVAENGAERTPGMRIS
ncbi:phage infection protein [Pseudomonas sp.]|uniref:phage infection protein n=1 Tax=Pseudomonas sp. TaxID=306 RepID=UPI003C77470B